MPPPFNPSSPRTPYAPCTLRPHPGLSSCAGMVTRRWGKASLRDSFHVWEEHADDARWLQEVFGGHDARIRARAQDRAEAAVRAAGGARSQDVEARISAARAEAAASITSSMPSKKMTAAAFVWGRTRRATADAWATWRKAALRCAASPDRTHARKSPLPPVWTKPHHQDSLIACAT